MKKLITPVVLAFVLFALYSFKPEGYRDLYKNEGSISATINGQTFQLRDSGFYRAMLVTKVTTAAASGRQMSRTVTSLLFYGNDSTDAQNNTSSETLNIEYTFNQSPDGDATDVAFDMTYNFGDYYMMPERNYFKVSKLEMSSDKTYFTLSGSFNCMMHRRGYSSDLQPAVRVKGEVADIKVSIPPWIAAKLNTQASIEGQ